MRRHRLSLVVPLVLAVAAGGALAESSPATETAIDGAPDTRQLERVVVTATRTAHAMTDVPATVDQIDRADMDAQLVTDLKDLFRYQPGISVTSSFGRFGLGDIRIRGLGGNRVRIETDGIAVPDALVVGSYANANRNFVDLDTLKRVEVLRGPGSALYGSDALGGVVAFATKDPADYLKTGRSVYASTKFGYAGANNGRFAGGTLAAGHGHWSALLVAGKRRADAGTNQGDNASDGAMRTAPNPQHGTGNNVLGKLVYTANADQRLRLTVERNADRTDTDMRSAIGFQPMTHADTLGMTGLDRQRRTRVSLDHAMDAVDGALANRLHWLVYRQRSVTTQHTDEHRVLAGEAQRRQRVFDFSQQLTGAALTAFKDFTTATTDHAVTYGASATFTRTAQQRDGVLTHLATSETSNVMLPDVFPVRDFPRSDTTALAVFVQDEITLADGALRLVPAVRVDRYRLQPHVDAIFAEDNPDFVASGLRATSVAPKLGAVWNFAADWSTFASYAHGFRSPPYNDVNAGFTNLAFGYTSIGNPALKPETSDGFELGLRYSADAAFFSLSAYDNRYRQFIESGRLVGINDDGLRVFQSQNIARARIHGVELSAGADLGALMPHLDGWSLRSALASAQGTDQVAHEPLATVDPLRATLGLRYTRTAWGVELAGRFAQRKRHVAAGMYRPAGYGVLDLLAHWQVTPDARVNVGLFNLGDKTWTDWADVNGVAASMPALARYTRPGRSLSASLSLEW